MGANHYRGVRRPAKVCRPAQGVCRPASRLQPAKNALFWQILYIFCTSNTAKITLKLNVQKGNEMARLLRALLSLQFWRQMTNLDCSRITSAHMRGVLHHVRCTARYWNLILVRMEHFSSATEVKDPRKFWKYECPTLFYVDFVEDLLYRSVSERNLKKIEDDAKFEICDLLIGPRSRNIWNSWKWAIFGSENLGSVSPHWSLTYPKKSLAQL